MYTDRSYHSTIPSPCGLPPAGQPNAACMRTFGAPSSAYELRWALGTVADVEPMVGCLLSAVATGLAPTVVFTLASNTSQ